jgi:hypothetical protein
MSSQSLRAADTTLLLPWAAKGLRATYTLAQPRLASTGCCACSSP